MKQIVRPIPRIIPLLLLKNGGLYKSIRFKNLTYIGDPINTVKIFNDKCADELIILDINSSKEKKGPNFELLKRIASECFMPLCYGGGIASVEDAKKIFKIGIEKISLQSSALANPALISELVEQFGSQSIVLSIDIKKNFFGRYNCINHIDNSVASKNIYNLIDKYVSLGVGEILLNFIDRDGMMCGVDDTLIKEISNHLDVPLIVCGGISSENDIATVIDCGADGVAVGSFFVFKGPHKAVLITYTSAEKLFPSI